MGCLDYYLHEFILHKVGLTSGRYIGIPQLEADKAIIGGWDVRIKKYFASIVNSISYDYDFGDGWKHEVMLIGILLAEEGKNYPSCVAGERACPPEDCGGPIGFQSLLDTLASPHYDNIVEWLKGNAKKY